MQTCSLAGRLPIATHIVTKVRKQLSDDYSHWHIAGVCLDDGTYHTRQAVVDSINAGDTWITRADGSEAKIAPITYCPYLTCMASPYITTNPDGTRTDNLEHLDEC